MELTIWVREVDNMNNFQIIDGNVERAFMSNKGILCRKRCPVQYLSDANGIVVSRPYYHIMNLGDNHFGVCQLLGDFDKDQYYSFDDYLNGFYKDTKKGSEASPKIKCGIIRLDIDSDGTVIESVVSPLLFDGLEKNQEKTCTVLYNDKFGYFDLDVDSDMYAQLFVPAVLDYAGKFYDGVAIGRTGDYKGYILRNPIIEDRNNLENTDDPKRFIL